MSEFFNALRRDASALWRNADAPKRLLLAGVPALVVSLALVGGIYAEVSGGGGAAPKQEALAPTLAPATPTMPPTNTPPPPTPAPTDTPAPTQATSASSSADSSSSNGSADNASAPADAAPAAAPAADLTGPGPELGTGWSLSIPSIGVDAGIYSRTIGTDGQMGNPSGPSDVIWYDFAANAWTGLGGVPGQPNANVVIAGHVDYCCPSPAPAVFWSIRDLQPGDVITVNTPQGPINYAVQWGQWADPDQDFTQFVAQTGQESITLVTCIGQFSGGHYTNRYILRGVRI
jgi:LPXTG-site transpeptidase (sortase) family protein